MEWVAAIALIFSMAAWAVAFFLWRRLRRLKRQAVRKSPTPAHLERGLFDSVELSLAAMLEELELKEREILQRIERRERELFDSIARVVGHAESEPIPVSEPAGDEVGQPAHRSP